jgi:hypothetical protein
MSDSPALSPSNGSSVSSRPVSLIVKLFVLALSAVFLVVVWRFYQPVTVLPQNAAAENLPKELEWKATPASRRLALEALQVKQAKQAAGYAWIDEKAGVVQLPVDRAMELVVQQYGAKK